MSLDVKTILFGYFISNLICTGVIALLWYQNRYRLNGLGFWLADFILQSISLLLVTLRGVLPDFVSMVVGNAMVMFGTILLYHGLGIYFGRKSSQVHNYILLTVFVAVHSYFVFITPSLKARNVNMSIGLLVICSQVAWLAIRRVGPEMRRITYWVGFVFFAYCFVNVIRIFLEFLMPPGDDFFTESSPFDTFTILVYQMLFISLTFSLFLMVNQGLARELLSNYARLLRSEETLRLSEERFSKAFQVSPDAISITRVRDGKIVEINEGFSNLLEYTHEEALKSTTFDLNLWCDFSERVRFMDALEHDGRVREFESKIKSKSGRILDCLISGELIEINGEKHVLSVTRNVSEYKMAENALRESRENFQRYFNMNTIGMAVTTQEKSWLEVNDHLCQMLGYSKEELASYTWADLTHPDDLAADLHLFNQFLSGEIESGNLDKRFISKNGSVVYTNLYASCHRDQDGKVLYFIDSYVDITERRVAEEELRRINKVLQTQLGEIQELQKALQEQAIRDPLTSLYNRRYLHDALEREFSRAKREGYSISLFMMDIDNFKKFNDTHGHQVGDAVLMALGNLLHNNVRQADVACRYGGEEFIVVMAGISSEDAVRRAETIRQEFESMFIDHEEKKLSASISIGVAFYPAHGKDVRRVIKSADEALYEAKQQGRNQVRVSKAVIM